MSSVGSTAVLRAVGPGHLGQEMSVTIVVLSVDPGKFEMDLDFSLGLE